MKKKILKDIFFYAIDYQKKKEDAYKIFHLRLIVQLIDNLIGICNDKLEGKIIIFTRGVVENTKNVV